MGTWRASWVGEAGAGWVSVVCSLGDSGLEVGDLGSGFEFLSESLIVDGQSLDVGDGEFQVIGQVSVGAEQGGVAVFELSKAIGRVLGCGRWGGGSGEGGDFAGGVGKVAPEGGVGQAEVAGESHDGRAGAGRAGFGEEAGLGVVDLVLAGQRDLAGHRGPFCWRARKSVISSRRLIIC